MGNYKTVVYFEDTSEDPERSDLAVGGSKGMPESSLPFELEIIEKRLYPGTDKIASILTGSLSESLIRKIRESASWAGTVAWIREEPSTEKDTE